LRVILSSPAELNIPIEEKLSAKKLDLAIKLIDHLTGAFHPEQYKDTYSEEIKKIIEKKAHGKLPKPKGEKPIPTAVPDLPSIRMSEFIEEKGTSLFRAARENGVEGIVAENGKSIYQSGVRNREWLKIKNTQSQEAVIGR